LIGVNPSRTLLHYFDFRPSCWVRRAFPGHVFFLQSVKKLVQGLFKPFSVHGRVQGDGLGASTKSGMRCKWRRNVGGGVV
ncbi:MAG: hypothetical protein WBZ67_14300, partial [Pseudolabrys sp.]